NLRGVFFRSKRKNFWLPASRLLERRFHVRARGQRHQLESLRIVFDDVERAAANGASRAEDGYAFHGRWMMALYSSMWKNHNTGAASKMASIRSKTPPCPGKSVPESFTPAPRLKADSTKSPDCAAMLTQNPKAAVSHQEGATTGTSAYMTLVEGSESSLASRL